MIWVNLFIDLFKNNKINLIVLDIQTQNYFDYSNLFRKSLNIFLSIGEKNECTTIYD